MKPGSIKRVLAIAAITLWVGGAGAIDPIRSNAPPEARGPAAAIPDGDETTTMFPEDPHAQLKRSIHEHPSYRCHLDRGTRNVTCIDSARVRSNGDIRASELLAGRPEHIRGTGITLVVNCTTMREALMDGNGVPVPAEPAHSVAGLTALGAQLCAAADTVRDSTLNMA